MRKSQSTEEETLNFLTRILNRIVFINEENISTANFIRNSTLINSGFMRRYFFFMQGEKRRRCRVSARLFNAA